MAPLLASYADNHAPIRLLDESFRCSLKISDSPVELNKDLDLQKEADIPPPSTITGPAIAPAVNAITKRKRVRFNREKRIMNPGKEYYTDEEVATKFWTSDELYDIKLNAKRMSTVLRRQESASAHGDVTVDSCRVTMAHRKTTLMLAGDFRSLMKLSPTSPDQDLQQWCSYDDGRRGLERFSSRDYSCLRKRDILNTRKAVLTEQAMQREMGGGMRDEEAIARLSRECSRRERTFSVYLAEADAKQAKKIALTSSREAPKTRALPPRKRSRIGEPGELPRQQLAIFAR